MLEVSTRPQRATAPSSGPDAPPEAIESGYLTRFRIAGGINGAVTILIGAVVLVGWLFRIPLLRSLFPGWVEMKPNTALCLVAGGASLILTLQRPTRPRLITARLMAMAVMAVGGATLVEYSFGWDLHIDQALFHEPANALFTFSPGRMAFSTTLCFIFVGFALLLLQTGRPRSIRWAQRLALASSLVGILSLIGYVYNVRTFTGIISYSPMAVHTAAGFLLLGIGILLGSAEHGFMSVVSSPASGGALTRKLLPIVIGLPPLLGVLRVLGARAGWYPHSFGISLKDGVVIVLLATVVWASGRKLNRFHVAQQALVAERTAALEELQAAHAVLEATNERLATATAAAEHANHAKSDFLSRMSHELRTPLNAIIGFAQLLQMDELEGDQRESVDEISRGGRHLLALTNDILDIARIESGRLSISLEPLLLRDVLDESLALARPFLDAGTVELDLNDGDAWDEFVLADQQRLRQVIINLLSNAVKYNREGGRVEISCAREADGIVSVRVSDTGVGIAAEQMPSLFTPFERLGAELSNVEGTGLGLALSERLVEAMGGTISVESEPGRGTTFTVSLSWAESPLARPDPELDPSVKESPTEGRLLYVEDNAPNLKLVERALSHRPGIELLTAMTGEAGLEIARRQAPAAILLDLNLPGMDGADVLAALQRDPATTAIPVIVLSADATPRRIKELHAAGAHAYVTKPFDLAELLELIDQTMTLRRVNS